MIEREPAKLYGINRDDVEMVYLTVDEPLFADIRPGNIRVWYRNSKRQLTAVQALLPRKENERKKI